jgi:hypothetical protein
VRASGSSLRSSCEQRIDGVPVPQPFDLAAFARALARHRGRPLYIQPLPGLDGSDGLSGFWINTVEADYVCIDADASPWHRNLIGLHELGHILCGHHADARWLHDMGTALLPGLSEVTITRMLGRHGYTSREEREAELTASLILERADADPLAVTAPGTAGIAGRLAHALRHPVRHV